MDSITDHRIRAQLESSPSGVPRANQAFSAYRPIARQEVAHG
jgi:hypothetical protein